MRTHKIKICMRPVFLSALSLLISFLLIQPLACFLDPTLDLLANRGIGKIAFTTMAILQLLLLLNSQSKLFCRVWLKTNVLFIAHKKWLPSFCLCFSSFFLVHWAIIAFAVFYEQATFSSDWHTSLSVSMLGRIGFGFIATFFLAWSEELIFRGTLYPYFAQYLRPISSILITSTIFMLVHNLTNPLQLITAEWDLGLGLFLLGMLLNLMYHMAGNLHAGIGIHAGLVFVKVLQRRLSIITHIPETEHAWWFAKDLRQAHFVHILFVIAIVLLIATHWKRLTAIPRKIDA